LVGKGRSIKYYNSGLRHCVNRLEIGKWGRKNCCSPKGGEKRKVKEVT